MRSSKSRSRNKNHNNNNNRNRQSGNNMNRVFDSSGPEGKVRGTPQQIIDKYSQLARDATLSNDRVAAENFQQHSEHYTRMLAEAQVEIDAKREQQEREHRERQQARAEQPRQAEQSRQDNTQSGGDQPREQRPQHQPQETAPKPHDLSSSEQPDVVQPMADTGDTGLVDTPEQAPAKKPRARRKPKAAPVTVDGTDQPTEPKAAE